MDIQKTLNSAKDIALFKLPTYKKVASDKDALVPAFVIIAAMFFIAGIGRMLFPVTFGDLVVYRPDFGDVIAMTLGGFLSTVVQLYLMGWLSVALFKSKLDVTGFVKVLGFGTIVNLLMVIPSLGIISGIWGLVIFWKALSHLGGLSAGKIVALVLIEFVVMVAIGANMGGGALGAF